MILYKYYISRIVAIFTFALVAYSALGQDDKAVQGRAEVMKNLTRNGQQVYRYINNVEILHRGTRMTCDSAYLTKKQDIVEAFGHVVVTKDETVLYGDFLYYDGGTAIGKVYGKEVKLVRKDATLVTDTIYFNSKINSAYYTTGGVLTNPENKLVSRRGYYFSREKKYYFSGDVVMENKDGRLFTDSLEYGSETEFVNFYGPTRIFNKKNQAYCEKGWYDRKNEKGNFFINAYLNNKAQRLYGQDIFYDKKTGYAHAIGQVAIVDSARRATIYGGTANYWEQKKEAEVIDNPLLVMEGNDDTLFLKSSRFHLVTIPDSTLRDSTYRIIKALGAVKFFRKDIQGQCDSLVYNTKDSTTSMFVSPVIWSDNNQITADFIKAFSGKNNKIKRVNFDGSAFIASKEEGNRFSQVKGKTMLAHFTDGEMTRLDVSGNGQSVYYYNDKGVIVAVNKLESTDIAVYFKNNKISHIKPKKNATAVLYPLSKVDPEELVLKGLQWLDDSRPKTKFDIIPKGLNITLINPNMDIESLHMK